MNIEANVNDPAVREKAVSEAVRKQLLSLWSADNPDSTKLANHLVSVSPVARKLLANYVSDNVVLLSGGDTNVAVWMTNFIMVYPSYVDGAGLQDAVQLIKESQVTGTFFHWMLVEQSCLRPAVMIAWLMAIKEEIVWPGFKQVSQVPELRDKFIQAFPTMSEMDWAYMLKQVAARYPNFNWEKGGKLGEVQS